MVAFARAITAVRVTLEKLQRVQTESLRRVVLGLAVRNDGYLEAKNTCGALWRDRT
jgi:hypothetical protein